MKDTGHYYDKNGKAVFEVPNKSKGGMRPTTLRDCRKYLTILNRLGFNS